MASRRNTPCRSRGSPRRCPIPTEARGYRAYEATWLDRVALLPFVGPIGLGAEVLALDRGDDAVQCPHLLAGERAAAQHGAEIVDDGGALVGGGEEPRLVQRLLEVL